MKQAPLVQVVIGSLTALLLVGGSVYALHIVKQLSSESAALRSEIAAKDAERARSTSVRSGETELVATESYVASHFLKTEDIVSFLEELESTGTTFGAEVNVASLSGDDSASSGRISLSLSITGSFDAVMRTLGAIEHGSYANMVKDITMDTGGGDGTWSATGVFVVATHSNP